MARKTFKHTFHSLKDLRSLAVVDHNKLNPIVTNHAVDRLAELDRPGSPKELRGRLLELWKRSRVFAVQEVGHMRVARMLHTGTGMHMDVYLCSKPDKRTGCPVLTTVMNETMARSQLKFARSGHCALGTVPLKREENECP